jgi:hypothetical protein
MELGEVHQRDDGLWRVAVWPGRADVLLGPLDSDWPFVLIETWDGNPGWHEATVSVGAHDEPRLRLVRHHRFDLLVTPAEAIEIGRHLHAQGPAGGGLVCYQFRERPRAGFRLPDDPRGRADAMRGQGVDLAIDLPHDGEVAVVCSPNETAVIEYVQRLV